MGIYKLHSKFPPAGDQPEAIAALTEGLRSGKRCQTLRGDQLPVAPQHMLPAGGKVGIIQRRRRGPGGEVGNVH